MSSQGPTECNKHKFDAQEPHHMQLRRQSFIPYFARCTEIKKEAWWTEMIISAIPAIKNDCK